MAAEKPAAQSFVEHILPGVRAGKSGPAQQLRECVRLLAQYLHKSIEAELKADRYVLLDWPAYSNIGDHAIYLGTRYLLGKRLNAKCLYSSDIDSFDAAQLNKIPADVPILFQGGGNLGDVWPRHQLFRESVLKQFPKRRFILLPQTLFFMKPEALKRAATAFRAHPNLTVYLRDLRSFKIAKKGLGAERVRLAPDMALALFDLMPELTKAIHIKPDVDLLCLFRADKARSGLRPAAPAGAWVTDWPDVKDKKAPQMAPPQVRMLAERTGILKYLEARRDGTSWRQFVTGVGLILKARRVMTDRLHGHIFAMLCGRPHQISPNHSHKIQSFHRTWTAGMPGVQFKDYK